MISLKKITGLFSESAARYFSQHEGGRPSPMREIFSDIYRTGAWEGTESVSGPGSSVEAASSFRGEIPKVLRDLGARSLLDAPCGDFNRMKELRLNVGAYTGVDVVPEIVERNISNHAGPGVTFLTLDITRDRLPRADVILCRDCLVHFSLDDIKAALRNLKRSKSRYLLTTTFTGFRRYTDISTGEWRPINLQLAPFNFPSPIRLIDERCARGRHLLGQGAGPVGARRHRSVSNGRGLI